MQIDSVLNTSEMAEDVLGYSNQNDNEDVYEFIAHFGIKGQKWGIRRFQNPDGSLTEAGRKRYSGSKGKETLRKDFKDDLEGEGKILKQIASDRREKAVSALSEAMENDYSDVAADGNYLKEKGYVKNNREAAEYLIKAAQKCNENYDDDVSMFQSLGRELDLYQRGYIDKKTFDALYDARAAEDIMEFERNSYDWHGEGAEGAVNANKYKSNLNNRLSYWFGDNPSNPEYNPNKPISVNYLDYDDLVYLREIYQSFRSEGTDFIEHHGIKGQKWGLRRFQNPDGSLTPEGRTHYGVGPALKKAGSAIGKAAGKAARKALHRQTDEELDEEYKKAQRRNERKEKQRYIDESKGKKKSLSKMSDEELDDYINRKAKEKQVKAMEKELKEMDRGYISKFMKTLGDNAMYGVGEGVKRGVANTIDTNMRKSAERKQSLKDDKFKKKYKPEEVQSEKLEREAKDSKNALDTTRNKADKKYLDSYSDIDNYRKATEARLNIAKNATERGAYLGSKKNIDLLETVASAKKGNKPEIDNGKKAAQNARDAALAKISTQALSDDPAVRKEANRILSKYQASLKGNKRPKSNS